MLQSRLRQLLSTLGALVALATPSAAQETSTAYGAAVDVEVVTVEVWVTDRQGRPVSGLEVGDFELRHDGEGVPISHFAEISAPRPVTASTVSAPAAESAAAGPAATPPGHLVLYFDQLNLSPREYGPLLAAVNRLLAEGSVPPERVMVMRQDRELHLEVPFGSSREALTSALSRIAASPGLGDAADIEGMLASVNLAWQEAENLSGTIGRGLDAAAAGEAAGQAGGPRAAVGGTGADSIGGAGMLAPSACDAFIDRVASTVAAWVHERSTRTAVTVGHLYQAGVILAGVPGVKTLVLLSDALETEPSTPLAAAIGALCPGVPLEIPPLEISQRTLALTRHLNSNQITVHALQAGGLRVDESSTAGRQQIAGAAHGGRMGSAFDSALRISERRGLGVLADETGGRLVVNTNDLGGELARIGDEMGSYYSLAYQPPGGSGKGEHRIEVALADRSLQARHRRGYSEKNAEQRLKELLEGALYLGLTANPLQLRLGAGEVRPKGDRFVLPLHLIVPFETLTFLGPPEKPAAELQLQVLTRHTTSPQQESKGGGFRVLRPEGPGGAAQVAVELELERGTHVVVVALRDNGSRATSLVSTTLDVGL